VLPVTVATLRSNPSGKAVAGTLQTFQCPPAVKDDAGTAILMPFVNRGKRQAARSCAFAAAAIVAAVAVAAAWWATAAAPRSIIAAVGNSASLAWLRWRQGSHKAAVVPIAAPHVHSSG